MKTLDYDKIADRIRDIRLQRGLTQENLAEAADVNQSHINNVENHRSRLSLTALVNICRVMDVSVDYILGSAAGEPEASIDLEILREAKRCDPKMKERLLTIIRALQ